MMSMCVCVCVSVSDCEHISATTHQFFVNVPTAVARCCSGSIVINVACFRFYG